MSDLDYVLTWCHNNSLYTLSLGDKIQNAAQELAQLRLSRDYADERNETISHLRASISRLSTELNEYKDCRLELLDKIEALETALKCASACNYKAGPGKDVWRISSPFQQEIINELVGPPPYGDKE